MNCTHDLETFTLINIFKISKYLCYCPDEHIAYYGGITVQQTVHSSVS